MRASTAARLAATVVVEGEAGDMDARLVNWARRVKARATKARRLPRGAATLWLFTDAARLPAPLTVIRRLPPRLAGVVLRTDTDRHRAALGRQIAELCRARHLELAVAGDWRLAAALHAGLHLRGGRRPWCAPRRLRALTSSAHGLADLVRARRAGAALAFLSPVFSTASHPGAPALGPVRWAATARRVGGAAALGGLDGMRARRLDRNACRAVGAIGALV
jgi:thiamine-phosphate pyrophosphorylase